MLEFSSLQGPVAQSGSAPRSHRGGQGFESPQVHNRLRIRGVTPRGQVRDLVRSAVHLRMCGATALLTGSCDVVYPLSFQKFCERFAQLLPGDRVSVHVEPREERLIEECPDGWSAAAVEPLRLFQQRQGLGQYVAPLGQLAARAFQGRCDVTPLVPDGVDLDPQLVLRPALLSRKIEVVVLFAVKGGKPSLVLGPKVCRQLRIGCRGGVELQEQSGPEVSREGPAVCRSGALQPSPGPQPGCTACRSRNAGRRRRSSGTPRRGRA